MYVVFAVLYKGGSFSVNLDRDYTLKRTLLFMMILTIKNLGQNYTLKL